jgi:hypothetical protein
MDVLRGADLVSFGQIERRFLERAANFGATLSFLFETEAISAHGSDLALAPEIAGDHGDIGTAVTGFLFGRESRYREEALAYLGRFDVKRDRVAYRPDAISRGQDSCVRNFLMELGLVRYDEAADEYVLSPSRYDLFVRAKTVAAAVSPRAAERARREREAFGMAAEVQVLAYEKRRVGLRFLSQVEHVSVVDCAVGYDIRSVSLVTVDDVLPRYIEVKAVSPTTYAFFWTAQEVSVAKAFGEWYHLYLVPVGRTGKCDMDGLRIIPDPCSALLKPSGEWTVEPGVVFCYLTHSREKP